MGQLRALSGSIDANLSGSDPSAVYVLISLFRYGLAIAQAGTVAGAAAQAQARDQIR